MKRVISIAVAVAAVILPRSGRGALRNGKIRSRSRKLPDRIYLLRRKSFPEWKGDSPIWLIFSRPICKSKPNDVDSRYWLAYSSCAGFRADE
jgi:hypothetical protein